MTKLPVTFLLEIAVPIAALTAYVGQASAQYVCQFNDTQCQERRMKMQHQLERELNQSAKRRKNRNTPLLGMRRGRIHSAQPKCDVKPVISGETTRVVPTCAE